MQVTSEGMVPSPPIHRGLFTPGFMKGDDDSLLACDSSLGNELVFMILLNGIITKEYMEKYEKVPKEMLRTK